MTTTFEYRINYTITDINDNILTNDDDTEQDCGNGIILSENIEEYLHNIILDDIFQRDVNYTISIVILTTSIM